MKNFSTFYLFAVLVSVGLMGCSGTNPESMLRDANKNNIQKLSNLYIAFQSQHDWRGPDDEAEFKEFLSNYPARKLERVGIDPGKVEDIFFNDRDGKPFKIRYQVQGHIYGSASPVIFEQEGKDGMRIVGFLDNTQREVNASDYDSLFAGESDGNASAKKKS